MNDLIWMIIGSPGGLEMTGMLSLITQNACNTNQLRLQSIEIALTHNHKFLFTDVHVSQFRTLSMFTVYVCVTYLHKPARLH